MTTSFVPLQRFIDFYQQPVTVATLSQLGELYHPSIVFIDPAHRVEGFDAFERYFQTMLGTVSHCQFVVHHCATDLTAAQPVGFADWTMTLGHPRLNGGQRFEMAGATSLLFSGSDSAATIVHHRDHFDLGAMLYERLPLLGAVVRRIRSKLGQ